jgi:hypothetical protein
VQYLRDAVSERRLRSSSWEVCGAHEHFNSDGAVVDLDTVKGRCGLDGLVVLVENNRSAA